MTEAADVLAQPLFGNPWLGGWRVLLARSRVVYEVLSAEWRVLLGTVWGVCDGCASFVCGDTDVVQVTQRVWHRLLVDGCVKPATALAAWSRRFAGHDMSTVWRLLKSPWIPTQLFHTNFMLLHCRVFTSVVLH